MDRKKMRIKPAQILWNITAYRLLQESFPDNTDYDDSKWKSWLDRIELGHREEEERIKESLRRWEAKHPASTSHRCAPDWIAEDWVFAGRITQAMYASLVVAIWADIEDGLNQILRCWRLSNKTGHAEKTKDKDKIHNFRRLKEAFQKEINLPLDQLSAYPTVNAIRLLNNYFKHKNGRCPTDKKESGSGVVPDHDPDRIADSLAVAWRLEKGRPVDYTRLPFPKMLADCHMFCKELMERLPALSGTKPCT